VTRFIAVLFSVLSVFGCMAGEGNMSPFVYVAGYHNSITCFTLDMATGELKPSSVSDGGKNPTYIAWSPNKKFMYACNELDAGRVTAFSINPKDGSLTKINDAGCAGKGPCHVSVSPSGKWVFVANYGSGHFGVLPIKADGSVGEPLESILAGKNAHESFADSTGKFLFVPCLGSDYVAQYLFDDATGAVKPNDPPNAPGVPKAGPRHMTIHPNGKWAYLINEQGLTITSFMYNAAKGTLSDPQAVPTVPEGTDTKGLSTAHVMVSPDGKFVYGSNRGFDDIVIYSIDQNTGRLTLVAHENGGGDVKFPRDFNIDPTGKFVLVANQKGNTVTVFKRDAASGKMEKLSTVTVPAGPSFVGVMTQP